MHYTIKERFLRVVGSFVLSIIFLLILLLVPLSGSSHSDASGPEQVQTRSSDMNGVSSEIQ